MAAKSNLKNMALSLTLVCLVCSALLGGVYAVTAQPIADAQAAKTALADPTERATLEAGFKAQSKYTSLYGYTVAQKYVKPNFGN